MKKFLIIMSLVASVALINGCGPSRYTVSDQPATPMYNRPVSPGARYVWVDGDWYWRGGRYVYRRGYWTVPRGHRIWIAGGWVHNPRGYYWRHGYWK